MSQVLIIHEMWAGTCSEATEANIKLSQPRCGHRNVPIVRTVIFGITALEPFAFPSAYMDSSWAGKHRRGWRTEQASVWPIWPDDISVWLSGFASITSSSPAPPSSAASTSGGICCFFLQPFHRGMWKGRKPQSQIQLNTNCKSDYFLTEMTFFSGHTELILGSNWSWRLFSADTR